MDPVAVGALGELIATAIAAAAGKSWKTIRPSPEAQKVKTAIDQALAGAFRDAYLGHGEVTADDGWIRGVAGIWESAFTAEMSQALIGCLVDAAGAQREFAALARQALQDSGCDIAKLERTFWVEQFLCVLPRLLFDLLQKLALGTDSAIRDLVGHLLDQRAEARLSQAQIVAATPRQFRQDVIELLHRLDEEARTGRMPPYLPQGADVSTLARTVRVRRGVRVDMHSSVSAEMAVGRAYQLPVERADDSKPAVPWPEVVAGNRRLMVLADPGLGKSWLIRTETYRLCQQALAAAERGEIATALLIPVPARCDQLVAGGEQILAEAAALFLVTERLIPPRSQRGLQEMIEAGGIVLLLDALDELATDEEYGQLKEMLRSWQAQAGDSASCVLTSRIAGYRGSPLADACEVELQAFTPQDVTAAITAWRLPPAAADAILARTNDPAVAGMTRIPLLLALLCSLAAELPDGQQLPVTREQLYERVLRWFLTRAHRAEEHPRQRELLAEDVDAVLDILAPVAFHFATLPSGWTDLMPPQQLRTAIRLAGPAFTERNRAAGDIVQELSIRAGILVPAGNPSEGRSPSYLFLHRTVAEYLVARHLASLPAADWRDVVDQHRWFDPDWGEVIPMLGERLSPAAACTLIEHLAAAEVDPFHHSLLIAARVWTARPDADQVLPAERADEIAGRLTVVAHHAARYATALTPQLTTMAYVPQPLLTRLLVDSDRSVREAVARALAGWNGTGVTEALLGLCTDPDQGVRHAAARELAARQGPDVTKALQSWLSDPAPFIRETAAMVLAGREGPSATEALLGLLSDDEQDVRQAAAKGLEGREGREVTEALRGACRDPDQWVRQSAARALEGRQGTEVTEALQGLLSDPNVSVRRTAAKGLAGQEGRGAVESLLGLCGDRDPYVRQAAGEGLARREGPEVTNALRGLCSDPDEDVRDAAADALAGREGQVMAEALRGLLSDPDEAVQETAMRALRKWAGPGEGERALLSILSSGDPGDAVSPNPAHESQGRGGPAVAEGLAALLSQPDRTVQQVAAKALAHWKAPDVTTSLLGLLSNPSESARWAAAQVLTARDEASVTEALLRLLSDPGSFVRWAAADGLADRKGTEVTEALQGMLGDPDRFVRGAAARALADREGPGVTEALMGLLHDPYSFERRVAAQVLAGRQGAGVAKALISRLSDQAAEVRRAAAEALVGREGVEVTKALISRLSDQAAEVRRAAAKALADRKGPSVTAALRDLLSDPDYFVRWAVVDGVAGRKGPDATGALLSLLSDDEWSLRRAAANALAGRRGSDVTDALLGLLKDPSEDVRHAAAWALSSSEVTQELVDWVRDHEPRQVDLPLIIELAEQLTTRNYRRIAPSGQESLRSAMAWLTTFASSAQSN